MSLIFLLSGVEGLSRDSGKMIVEGAVSHGRL